jgi:hypothetical protein
MKITCLTTVEREVDIEAMLAAHGVSDLTVLDVTLLREDGIGAEMAVCVDDNQVYHVTAYADGGWVQIEDDDGGGFSDDEQQFFCTLTAHVIGLADNPTSVLMVTLPERG